MKNEIAIIPIRMKSSRLPNKPLKKILGIPLINHVYERAKLSFKEDNLFIAVCDEILYDYLSQYTKNLIKTSVTHKNAISRCYEAYKILKKKKKIKKKKKNNKIYYGHSRR